MTNKKIDLLRIYVLFHPASDEGTRLAALISNHFDGLGMERDGVSYRVPVRIRSEPWKSEELTPRKIELGLAKHNAIVLLHDLDLHDDRATWNDYVSQLRNDMDARGNLDMYVPFGSVTRDPPLTSDQSRHTQYARRDIWAPRLPSQPSRDQRLLLHLLAKLRDHLRPIYSTHSRSEPLFVSHAKADGDNIAREIVDFVNSSTHDVPLNTFYDAMELSPGEDFEKRFEREISEATLLAIVSDTYDSRPWCVYELTTAKRARRPIILADIGKVRTSRTYPYGSNLPRVRVNAHGNSAEWIEPLLVQTLSEGLRCDLFTIEAQERLLALHIEGALILPRPPELFDLIDMDSFSTLVYPDPPLGRIETEILEKARAMKSPGSSIRTLGEIG